MLYGAGPPCQGVSTAGKKRPRPLGFACINVFFVKPQLLMYQHPLLFFGGNLYSVKADPRTRCSAASIYYIKHKRPHAALIETVPGVLSNKKLRKKVYQRWVSQYLVICFGHVLVLNDPLPQLLS